MIVHIYDCVYLAGDAALPASLGDELDSSASLASASFCHSDSVAHLMDLSLYQGQSGTVSCSSRDNGDGGQQQCSLMR